MIYFEVNIKTCVVHAVDSLWIMLVGRSWVKGKAV